MPEKAHISWTKIQADFAKGSKSRTLFYYASMHPKSIIPFIEGTLPYLMRQDLEFARPVGPYVLLTQEQSIYAIYHTRNALPVPHRGHVPTAENAKVGTSFSPMEWIELAHDLWEISDFQHNSAATRQLRREIECAITSTAGRRQIQYENGDKDDCTFYSVHAYEDYLEVWLQELEFSFLTEARKRYNDDPSDPWLHAPFTSGPPYVGLSHHSLRRCGEHWGLTNRSEGIVFALLAGAVQRRYKGRFAMQQSSYQVFKTVRKSDIGLDEIAASVALGSYVEDTGLNISYAGVQTGSSISTSDEDHRRVHARHALEIQESEFLAANIAESHAKIMDWDRILRRVVAFQKGQDGRTELAESIARNLTNAQALEKKVDNLRYLNQASKLQKARQAYRDEKSGRN